MDVLTLLSTLLRRWVIVVAVLVLTAVAIAGLVLRAEPTYEMRGSFLVTSPELGATGAVPQGEVGFDDGSASAPGNLSGQVIAEAVQGGSVVQAIAEDGGTADYTVEVEGEVLRVLATDSDRATVVPTVEGVLEAIEQEVAEAQDAAGVPTDGQAAVERLAVPNDASVRGETDEEGLITYSAMGSARMVGPGALAMAGYNPYVDHPFTIRILEEALGGVAAQTRVAEAGGTGGFAVEPGDDQRDPAPIVYLAAGGTTPEQAENTFAAVTEVAAQELDTRQAALGVPDATRVSLFPLSVPSAPQQLTSGLARPLITVAGLGGATAIGLALLADNLLQGLHRRRKESVVGTEPAAEEDETVDAQPAVDDGAVDAQPAGEDETVVAQPAGQEARQGVGITAAVGEVATDPIESSPDADEAHAPVRSNGNGIERQARETMYHAVIDKVFGKGKGPTPGHRELMPPRTPTELP